MIGLAAGPLTKDAPSIYKAMHPGWWDFAVYKTVSKQQRAPYPEPTMIWSGQENLYNSVGLPSEAPEVWVSDLVAARSLMHPTQKLILSVADNKSAAIAGYLNSIDGIELNLSCPNADTEFDADTIAAIASNGIKIYLKLGPWDEHTISDVLTKFPYYEGVTAVNTLSVSTKRMFPGRTVCGVSGSILRNVAVDALKRLVGMGARNITSSGGVMTKEDIQTRLDCGASHVAVCTGAMLNPDLAKDFKLWKKQV